MVFENDTRPILASPLKETDLFSIYITRDCIVKYRKIWALPAARAFQGSAVAAARLPQAKPFQSLTRVTD